MRNSGFELQFFQSSNRLRAKTEVMEEISSQNSDLGLEDLDKLEAKGQAENTKKATSWGIKKFEKWCDKQKLKVDFNCVTPVEPSCQALFQTPNHHFKKAESRWLRNEPLGKNTIAKLMENISSKAELSER